MTGEDSLKKIEVECVAYEGVDLRIQDIAKKSIGEGKKTIEGSKSGNRSDKGNRDGYGKGDVIGKQSGEVEAT